jgi:hypothetical protein
MVSQNHKYGFRQHPFMARQTEVKKMDKRLIGVFSLLAIAGIAAMTATQAMAFMGDPAARGPMFNEEINAQLQQAIEDRDYESWKSIMEENNLPMNGEMFQVINEENFEQFAQMHEAMQNGDFDTANQIREELGIGMEHRHMAKFQGGPGPGGPMGPGPIGPQGPMNESEWEGCPPCNCGNGGSE